MGQALKDVPKTQGEYNRQKGPVPPMAVLLVIGLFLVFAFFFGPALVETLSDSIR